jgi:AraC-like DNA-binding protein
MHRCYEIILILEGKMKVRVENEVYTARSGDLILVKPNLIHSLETVGTSKHILCIFSPELISAVSGKIIKYKLKKSVIHDTSGFYKGLFMNMKEGSNIATVKGFLYLLCGDFYQYLDFSAEDNVMGDKRLLHDIFLYVENNIDNACSLSNLAKELKYSEAYLSRFFKANVGTTYYSYVRNIKISRACYLLNNTKDNILDIALKCGYTSLSSFNRSFKHVVGENPTNYRNVMKSNK